MPGEDEREEIIVRRKAAVYDLQKIFEKSKKKTFTLEEIEELMAAYILEANQA